MAYAKPSWSDAAAAKGKSFGGRRASSNDSSWGGGGSVTGGENAAALQYGKRVVPIMRKAELDLLPDGNPNTPWRRLAYQLRMAPDLAELLHLVRDNIHKGSRVWRPHLTALALTRTGALLYPRAVASGAADTAGGGTACSVSPPAAALKVEAHTLYQILSESVNKLSVRQVQGFNAARLLVAMAWTHSGGGLCLELAETLVRELCRQDGGKLAQVAMLDPPLYGRMLRALAQLVPHDDRLWVELQRLTLAALLQAKAQAGSGTEGAAGGGQGQRRLWGAAADDQGRPLPDCSIADLGNIAFSFAAAGRALPPVFDALREAVLSRELPADPDVLASLLWAWARAQLPPGELAQRAVAAFQPLLRTAQPRPLGRLVWALAALGLRNKAFLTAAGEAIVTRKMVFGSPQELVNVVWAFSRLGIKVDVGPTEQQRAAAAAAAAAAEASAQAARSAVREPGLAAGASHSMQWQAPGRAGRGGGGAVEAAAASSYRRAWGDGQVAAEEGKDASSQERAVGAGAAGPSGRWEGDREQVLQRRRPSRLFSGSTDGETSAESDDAAEDGTQQRPQVHRPTDNAAEPGQAPEAGAPAGAGSPLRDALRMRPLPLAAVAAAEAAHGAARAATPPLNPSSPLALYRYLAHSFLTGRVSNPKTKWNMSDPQMSVLAASFARAGYGNRPLFQTIGRMAMRRIATLAPSDLALLLWAHGHVRVKQDALVHAACDVVERRWREFSPRQLADVLWAVQVLMPRAVYTQLAEALRRGRLQAERNGTLAMPDERPWAVQAAATAAALPLGQRQRQHHQQARASARSAGIAFSGAGSAVVAAAPYGHAWPAGAGGGGVSDDGGAGSLGAPLGTVPALVLPLHVPEHLLDDDEYVLWRQEQEDAEAAAAAIASEWEAGAEGEDVEEGEAAEGEGEEGARRGGREDELARPSRPQTPVRGGGRYWSSGTPPPGSDAAAKALVGAPAG
ncbi:hypothetical protein GPECTOR_6g595 [Gonium pectorale]|uniref:FAST kinase leucine-rich domain-containing protein n=1 Tax=Gonium pectorale TaxID=33097 RepID=A0A150GVG3_GONPE|nr:hypothetical protein GPECTOR_6g595 [Gonium pectorale]|eukprot:KXZ53678.1 hypothetical protein GPECTOR_6g595 [Gonium pectorale]